MPKTNAQKCREYRQKKKVNKVKKVPKSSTERVRECRARRKALFNEQHNIYIAQNNTSTVHNSGNHHVMCLSSLNASEKKKRIKGENETDQEREHRLNIDRRRGAIALVNASHVKKSQYLEYHRADNNQFRGRQSTPAHEQSLENDSPKDAISENQETDHSEENKLYNNSIHKAILWSVHHSVFGTQVSDILRQHSLETECEKSLI
ncbi:hypothetical protein K1T71_012940 [Dendrolimus kikuchii]|uniref:Uncharacterized protein n=1 Tax=Dendrolimus kikuchii TaxID=765133 RepID=A0ACC1CII4_9NEOP|nr:hypothetical protein K1T71_012940 [Dendrolimus kikuchii]